MTRAKRVAVIESCRYVDEVIADSPDRLTQDFLDEHKITTVVHGNDLAFEGAEFIYGPAVAATGCSCSSRVPAPSPPRR